VQQGVTSYRHLRANSKIIAPCIFLRFDRQGEPR
jgi:hypothetical protein